MRFEKRFILIYLVLGILYIIFSDIVVHSIYENKDTLREIQTYKGWVYVIVTAVIFYTYLHNHLKNRRQAENALQENERRLNAIFNHHFQYTGLIDKNGQLLATNRASMQFKGLQEKDVIGKLYWECPWWSDDQKQEIKQAFHKALNKEFVRFETYQLNEHNEEITLDFSLNPVEDENGQVIYVIPEARDVTEMREVEAASIENELRFKNLSNNLPGGLTYELFIGKSGETREFRFVSSGVEKMHEVKEEEVIKNPDLIFSQVQNKRLLAIHEEIAMREMKPFHAELKFKLPSGKTTWSLLKSVPRKDAEGNIIWDGIEIDITKRKKAELELEKYQNELEEMVKTRTKKLEDTISQLKEAQSQLIQSEKMASLGVMTAGVAHEINNPLNYIMGSYTGLEQHLQEKGENDEKAKEFLSYLKSGIDRAKEIVDGLKQFSRKQENLDDLCNIESIINNCLLILHHLYENRIEIVKQYNTENTAVIGNVGKLHQALLNILTNAIQSIEDKGQITITINRTSDHLLIQIEDNGSGIEKEKLKMVFDPFFTTKPVGVGTGLGLSITYTIIQEHKGSIEIESTLNKGTIVKISLPNSQ